VEDPTQAVEVTADPTAVDVHFVVIDHDGALAKPGPDLPEFRSDVVMVSPAYVGIALPVRAEGTHEWTPALGDDTRRPLAIQSVLI